VHDVQFKIISRSSGTIADYEKGWKDTVAVPLGESVSFIAKFDDFADSTNPFMYHCHFSNHEDEGMMGQFLVVGAETTATPTATLTPAPTQTPSPTPSATSTTARKTYLPIVVKL